MLPLNNQVLIEYEEPKEKMSDGGLYVPPATTTVSAKDYLKEAKVLEVNPKAEHVKPGDTIYFDIRAKVIVPGTTNQYFVRGEDIYGIK